HTVKSIIITGQNRKVIYLSHIYGGHNHDYSIMKSEFDMDKQWFVDVTVRADLGFLGLVNDYGFKSDLRLPNKKPRKSKNNLSPELTKQQKIENRAHAQRRIFVEHSIGGMKHFHCLTHRIRSQSNVIMDQFFGLAAGLWNFNIS
ncbi:transposase family protein, partial [Chromatium okenii]|uniref:transposase family protein n=1 Tax=Chromatium okenii TaxID=61644 RepID=UPI001903D1FD